jgi:N,N-dimethylformamidase
MVGMSWGGGTYYRLLEEAKNPRAAFIFKGVKSDIVGDYGSHFGGAAGEEVDRYLPKRGTPSHALELARSENHPEPVFGPPEDVRASLVFFETPSGGAVFSVGSMAYVGALRYNEYDNDIARITANVLRRFLDPKSFEMPSQTLEDTE